MRWKVMMNILCHGLTLIVLLISTTSAFNLENRLPIYKFDTRNNSYFGYSVALHHEIEEDKKWILVGAPLGQNPQPNTRQSGTLKKCPITQKQEDCEDVLTDGRQNDDDDELFEPLPNEIKENQWLGVTVSSQKSNSTNPGLILVCAHRYISKPGNSVEDAQHGIGLCYLLGNDFAYDDVFEPCKGRTKDKLHEEYGVCQAGTSGTLLDDGTVVVGAPGVFTWRGSLFTKEVAGSYLKRDKNIYYTPHEGANPPIDKYGYLGMSVTAAKFFDDHTYSYVGGAPRSENHGQVIFFEKSSRAAMPMEVKMKLDGEQFASGFGYELATADVNGDNKPDLLVSAPFYFDKHEGGAVYVYLNDLHKIKRKYDVKLTGKLESRFGLALANIGDINKDYFEDIAIGAPYEGKGVVYIHLGTSEGLSKIPSQVIKASDLGLIPKHPIATFGSHISGGLDVDDNGYPDLVVGAYSSSAIIALLSRQIIAIHTEVPKTGDIKPIDPSIVGCASDPLSKIPCFSITTRCSIDKLSENSPVQTLNLVYRLEAETFNNQKIFSRVHFGDASANSNIVERNVTINTNNEPLNITEVVYIQLLNDIQTPIKFRLSYSLVDEKLADSGLKRLNPILDQTQADRTFEATFQKDCGTDDICESKLNVTAWLGLEMEKNGEYTFVLGKSDDIQLNVSVTNELDSAYDAQLFIVHQQSVTYIGASKKPPDCSRFNDTVVVCDLGNPLKRGAHSTAMLRFDPSGLEDPDPRLSFRIFANTTSKMIESQGEIILATNVIKMAELSIAGFNRNPQITYGGEIKGESAMVHFDDIGSPITHSFELYNDGPWRAPEVQVNIDWPHQVGNDKSQGKWLLYLESAPIIEGAQGSCTSLSINPLGLTKRPSTESLRGLVEEPEPALMRRPGNKTISYSAYKQKISSESSYEKLSTVSSTSSGESGTHNRVKRDRAMVIRAEKLTDLEGKNTNIVTMDCNKKTAKCVRISCKIYGMQRKTQAFIHIKARLWNSTLLMDYPRVDKISIISRAQLSIPEMYDIVQNTTNDSTFVETQALPEVIHKAPIESIPWWIIIVGILVGLFLLSLVAFILWKCGFFKRRRPDPTLSGNLEKNSESRPFLGN